MLFRVSILYRLVPDSQDARGAIQIPEHWIAVVKSGIQKSHQNPLPFQFQRRITLYRSNSCRVQRPQIEKRSEEHTSELQSRFDLVCRLLLEKKKIRRQQPTSRD